MPVVSKVEGQYSPHAVEEWVKKFWNENRIYDLVKAWRRGGPRYRFLDGPPYTSNDMPHVGTALNKVLKDAILRFWRQRGFDVVDTPGYDCHGLPIEVMVEKRLGVKVKKDIVERIGIDRFVSECKRFAQENLKSLTKWFKELGVFMDWDKPYVTMDDRYIEAEWWFLKRVWERGLLRQELRVVYWCPRCSTTLAEYEIEYREVEDPSIYVAFPLLDEPDTHLVIWTTTPWTLPANVFVMAHPDAEYVYLEVDGKRYVVARARLEALIREWRLKGYRVVKVIKGSELRGLRYVNPLEKLVPLQRELREYHRVVLAPEFVTLEEGTGLVHAAPGHGFEDLEVAKRIGVNVVPCPVDEEGRFTNEAGKYAGLYVREASEEIVDDLRKLGYLVYASRIVHRYPVCWRCKTPIILRATRQWVIRVTDLIEEVRREAKNINWVPSWALARLWSMLENPRDWVISRQRFWGTPLPIWVCESCGYVHVVGSVDELVEMGGSRPRELHRPWIDEVVLRCPRCGGEMRRVPDVADVWMDSGVSFYASIAHPQKGGLGAEDVVADFITEGHDQIRGWFFSLLRVGVLAFGRAPYRSVLVHGFMLDEKGREMHKSLGNYVGIDEVLSRVGRDPFRLWALSSTLWEDIRFSWKGLEEAKRFLGIAWNVFVFASTYMNLDNFDPTRYSIEDVKSFLRIEDRWLLSKLDELIEEVTKAMESYRVHEAARAVYRFIVEDVSHWYIKLVRPRVWVEEETRDKLALYVVLYNVLKTWLALANPFTPFVAEYLYQKFVKNAEPSAPPSVSMLEWPRPLGVRDDELMKSMDIARRVVEAVAAARMRVGLKGRHPVREVIVFSDREEIRKAIEMLRDVVKFMANTRKVSVKPLNLVKEVLEYRAKPRYSSLGPKYRGLVGEIARYIEERSREVAEEILTSGKCIVVVGGSRIELGREDVEIEERVRDGYSVVREPWGVVAIDVRLSDEEVAEGLARDIVRRIQFMRKMVGLELTEFIRVRIAVPEDHAKYVEKMLNYIAGETRAKSIEVLREGSEFSCNGFAREWDIDDRKYLICIERLGS